MNRCECKGGDMPACSDCERRMRHFRCLQFAHLAYGLTEDAPYALDGERVIITVAPGYVVTLRVDIDRDRVVEEVTSGR